MSTWSPQLNSYPRYQNEVDRVIFAIEDHEKIAAHFTERYIDSYNALPNKGTTASTLVSVEVVAYLGLKSIAFVGSFFLSTAAWKATDAYVTLFMGASALASPVSFVASLVVSIAAAQGLIICVAYLTKGLKKDVEEHPLFQEMQLMQKLVQVAQQLQLAMIEIDKEIESLAGKADLGYISCAQILKVTKKLHNKKDQLERMHDRIVIFVESNKVFERSGWYSYCLPFLSSIEPLPTPSKFKYPKSLYPKGLLEYPTRLMIDEISHKDRVKNEANLMASRRASKLAMISIYPQLPRYMETISKQRELATARLHALLNSVD